METRCTAVGESLRPVASAGGGLGRGGRSSSGAPCRARGCQRSRAAAATPCTCPGAQATAHRSRWPDRPSPAGCHPQKGKSPFWSCPARSRRRCWRRAWSTQASSLVWPLLQDLLLLHGHKMPVTALRVGGRNERATHDSRAHAATVCALPPPSWAHSPTRWPSMGSGYRRTGRGSDESSNAS